MRRVAPGATHEVAHAHEHLEFNLITGGRGAYFVEDTHYDLCAGTLVWLLPGHYHRLMRSPDLEMWVVMVHPDTCDPALLEDVARYPSRILSGDDAVALDRLLSHISQDTDEPQLYNCGIEYALRSARHISLTSAGPAKKKPHPAVLKTLSVLRSGAEAPSARELAKICGVAPDYLGQLLVEHTGRGLVDWRNRIRLERFQLLYPQSDDLLTAALDAGFGSYTQFHRVFAELVGTTPGEWAKHAKTGSAVALPSATTFAERGGESSRMIWYDLSDVVFPDAARWFTTEFASAFDTDLDGSDVSDIDSFVTSDAELYVFEPALVEQLHTVRPDAAVQLARIFEKNDLIRDYAASLGMYQLGIAELSNLAAIYLGLAWAGANIVHALDMSQTQKLAQRVRAALGKTGTLARASALERQRTAAAFICQAAVLRHALVGAHASGNDKLLHRVSDNAHRAALATFKIDLRAKQLFR